MELYKVYLHLKHSRKLLDMIVNIQLLQGLMFGAELYGWKGAVGVMAPLTTPTRNR